MSINNVTTSPETVNRNEMPTPLIFRMTDSGNAASVVQIAKQSARVHLQSSVNNFPAEVSLDDPRLTSEVLHENPDGDAFDRKQRLQHGLCRDSDGALRVRPDIEQAITPDRQRIANRLLANGEPAQANSFIACNVLQKIHGLCEDEATGEWHEAYITTAFCGKLLLCAPCSQPKSRVRKFHNDYPYLFEHLMHSVFHVITFTAPAEPTKDPATILSRLAQATEKFKRFMESVDGGRPKSESGWKFLPALSFRETKFFAIYQGPKLPPWPTLNSRWQAIAGPSAGLRCQMFDGKDGDDQRKGLLLAHSGFVDYHLSIHGTDLIPYAQVFADFDTSLTYGLFRGYDVREEQRRGRHEVDEETGEPAPVELCEDGFEHAPPVRCLTCARPIRSNPSLPMMTVNEILAKGARIYFGHSNKLIYARCGHAHNPRIEYRTLQADKLAHAPPS